MSDKAGKSGAPSAAKSCNPIHSPNANPKNKKIFASLSVPLERRKQTAGIGAWLGLFFGSIFMLLILLIVWCIGCYMVLSRAAEIYRAVYGTTSYYGSEKDREELEPKLWDHLDWNFLLLAGELVFGTIILAIVFKAWKSTRWAIAHRRLYPYNRASKGSFSREHELVTNTWGARLWANVYIAWSRCLTSYFPHKVVYDDESLDEEQIHAMFPEDKNYIFACHPHGMAAVSVWCTFCWRPTLSNNPTVRQTTGFVNSDTPMRRFMEKYFVYGVDFGKRLKDKTAEELAAHKKKAYAVVVHTLDANFIQPFWRELILRVGLRDVCRRAILNSIGPVPADAMPIAERREVGHLSRISCIVVGGAAESIDFSRPGTLTLKKRKGFVRMCVETGAAVVPVYSFGETSLYTEIGGLIIKNGKIVDSALTRFNRKMQKILGFALPLALGRGLFNYGIGFIPHRRPLVTVVGKPIMVKQLPRPKRGDKGVEAEAQQAAFDAEVDRAHIEYLAAVSELYRRHQPKLDPDCPVTDLHFK